MLTSRNLVPIERDEEYLSKNLHTQRFGNFDNVQNFPVVDEKNNIMQTADSFFNNQNIIKTVGEWYQSWQPWQQSALLCGIADRLSIYQLEALRTSLEPTLHRDYVNTSQKIYPTSNFTVLTDKLNKIEQLEMRKTKKKRKHHKRNAKRSVILPRPQTFSSTLNVDSNTLLIPNHIKESNHLLAAEAVPILDECNVQTDDELVRINDICKYRDFADSFLQSILTSAFTVTCQSKNTRGRNLNSSINDVNCDIDTSKNIDDYSKDEVQNVIEKHADFLSKQILSSAFTLLSGDVNNNTKHVHSFNGNRDYVNENSAKTITVNGSDNCEMSFFSVDSIGNLSILSHDCLGRVKSNKKKFTVDRKILPDIPELCQDIESESKTPVESPVDSVGRYVNQTCVDILDSALLNVAIVNKATDTIYGSKNIPKQVDREFGTSKQDSEMSEKIHKFHTDHNVPTIHDPNDVGREKIRKKKRNRRKKGLGQKVREVEETIDRVDEKVITEEKVLVENNSIMESSLGGGKNDDLIANEDPDLLFYQEYHSYYGNLATKDIRVVSPSVYCQDAVDATLMAESNLVNKPRLTSQLMSPNALPSRGSSKKTPDYFATCKLSTHGFPNNVMRRGKVNQPEHIDDISLPLQNFYKHEKWFLDTEHGSLPNRDRIKRHYRAQLAQIWEWLGCWEEYEQTNMLTSVIKQSDAAVLTTLYNHTLQRLSTMPFTEHLTDSQLLRILTYLSWSDLQSCALVCRHWYYLTNCQQLWSEKCRQIGLANVGDIRIAVLSQTMGHRLEPDWKGAYYSMICLQQEVKAPKVKFDHRILKDAKAPVVKADQSREGTVMSYFEEEDQVPLVDQEYWDRRPDTTKSHKNRHKYKRRYTRYEGVTTSMEEMTNELVEDPGQNQRAPESPTRGQQQVEDVEDATYDVRTDLVQARDILGNHQAPHALQWVAKDTNVGSDGVVAFAGKVKKVVSVKKLQGHSNGVMCLDFDKKRLISGGLDCTIRLWDVRSGRSLQKFYGHKGGIYSLDFDGSTHTLVTGSWDTTIMVWNLHSFERIAVLHEHRDCVSGLHLTPLHLLVFH